MKQNQNSVAFSANTEEKNLSFIDSVKTQFSGILKKAGIVDAVVGEVKQTGTTDEDYARFKTLDLNRDVNETNVKAIMDSIVDTMKLMKSKIPLPIPIIINELFEIIDGQHRLEALKRLNLPVTYLIIPGLTIDHVHIFQTGRPWKDEDWLKLWKGRGNTHYELYEEFRNRHKLGHWTIVGLLYGDDYPKGLNRVSLWRKGEFKVNYLKPAEDLMEMVNKVKPYLIDKLINKQGQVNRNFIYALNKSIKNTKFSFSRFLDNLNRKTAPTIENYGDEQSFLDAIFDVHNHGLSDDKKIKSA